MKSKYLTFAIIFATLALSVASAGCGGGSDTAEASLTMTEFRNKADFVCEGAGNEQYEKAGEYLSKHPGADQADTIELAGIPPLEKELRELKELPVPEKFESKMEAFLAAFESALQKSKEEPSRLMSKHHNPFSAANHLGEKYRLGDCSISP